MVVGSSRAVVTTSSFDPTTSVGLTSAALSTGASPPGCCAQEVSGTDRHVSARAHESITREDAAMQRETGNMRFLLAQTRKRAGASMVRHRPTTRVMAHYKNVAPSAFSAEERKSPHTARVRARERTTVSGAHSTPKRTPTHERAMSPRRPCRRPRLIARRVGAPYAVRPSPSRKGQRARPRERSARGRAPPTDAR